MHGFNGINYQGLGYRRAHHSGLAGILGGIINLTTTTLYGGASVIRRVVENSAWQGVSDRCSPGHNSPDCCSKHERHCYCIECVPTTYKSCCR